MNFDRLFLLREAMASCRMEGIEVSLEEMLIAMSDEEERQIRAARKRAKRPLSATRGDEHG